MGLIAGSAQDVDDTTERSPPAGTPSDPAARLDAHGGASFAGDGGQRVDPRRPVQSPECGRHEIRRPVVSAGRERDLDLAFGPSIELGRTPGARAGPTAEAAVLGLEQPGLDQPIEMEGRELAADAQRRDRLVAPGRLAAGDHQVVQPSAGGFGQCRDGFDRITGGRSLRHACIVSPKMIMKRLDDGRAGV
jgi:hypothetical protein